MPKFQEIDSRPGEPNLQFYCPGCGTHHGLWTKEGDSPRWHWNGSLDKPTVSPSILVHWGQSERCHSFITEGRIQYLTDCTHPLKGKEIDLPEIDNV